jgi:hypothetical protein
MTVTSPTVNTIKNRLADIAKTVSGIKRAYAEAPASLPESDFPAFIPFVGPVTAFEYVGEAYAYETRTYNLRLYVKPVQAGYSGEAEKAVEPFLTSVRDVFLSHPEFGLGVYDTQIPYVEPAKWLGDGGIVVLPFAGANYLGVEFRISAKVFIEIAIANHE